MNCGKESLKKFNLICMKRNFCELPSPEIKKYTSLKRSHAIRLGNFFRTQPNLQNVKKFIPEKYLQLKRLSPADNLYLIDDSVAKKIVNQIIEKIKLNQNQLVCETSAGLGFITSELLDNGVQLVRLYDSCGEFRETLKDFHRFYPNRIEIFSKDLFLLHRYNFMDKQDHGNRVEELLEDVPKKAWRDDPVMTIFGALSNVSFIHHLIRSIVLQSDVATYGRIQLYAFIRPKDFIVLTATPKHNLHTYQSWSVLFNLFFDYKLLDKFPRSVFLPWEAQKKLKILRFAKSVDPDFMYFVSMTFKKDLPVSAENLLPLFTFVRQFFGRGTTKIIPVLEKWVPGSGINALIPKLARKKVFNDMNIFTKFGELTPDQILYIFEEMVNHPEYKGSPFSAMIESLLIKSETIETSLDDHLEKNIAEEIETKFNDK